MFAAGADAHATDNRARTALHHAAKRGDVQAVRTLLALGTDGVRAVNVKARANDGRTALMTAVKHGHEQVVRALLGVGQRSGEATRGRVADIIADGISDTAVLNASEQHRPSSSVNARDNNGRTALMQAEERGRADVVRLLLEHGADVCACDEDGNNALHLAVCCEHSLDNPSHLLDTFVDYGFQHSKL